MAEARSHTDPTGVVLGLRMRPPTPLIAAEFIRNFGIAAACAEDDDTALMLLAGARSADVAGPDVLVVVGADLCCECSIGAAADFGLC